MNGELMTKIETLRGEMVETLSEMISYPAISPADGGEGEYRKARFLLDRIKSLGFGDVKVYASPDEHAAGGERPNIVVRFPGRSEKRLWIVAHTDVVPEGDISLWDTDPFKAVVKDGKIFGRGVNDNGQEVVSSLYALYALKELKITPAYEVCLAFVADEENGSSHGIQYLVGKNIFDKSDLVVVPDMGNERGDFIEVAEKSICWVEFTVEGKQTHGSRPNLGNNACRAANAFSASLDAALHAAFPEEDGLFSPPESTFEPTKRRGNVANINTVPGKEIFCFDCRVLPSAPLSEVEKVIESEIKKASAKYKVNITFRYPQKTQAPAPTDKDAEVVKLLAAAVRKVFPDVSPTVGGVGGGTCGAFFRRLGIPAVVWCQEADCAHMPNEYAVIDHIVNEAKVFACMMTGA